MAFRVTLLLLLTCGFAQADPTVLRLGTVAPEGSAWAREGQAFARDVERLTEGRVKVKIYFGGITGDEVQTVEQARKGRIDAIASGGMSCLMLAPALRVFRVPGLFRSRAEATFVSGQLRTAVDEEFLKSGFINLGDMTLGPDMFLSKQPIRSAADLKNTTWWIWDLDPVLGASLRAMQLHSEPVGLPEALHAFEAGRTQGFLAIPTAMLAFQWSTEARYLLDLPIGILRGCVIVTTRAFDALSAEDQDAVRAAGAKAVARLEDVGRAADEALLHGLFEKQGVTMVQPSETLRFDLFSLASAARAHLPEDVIPQALIQKAIALLADFRAATAR